MNLWENTVYRLFLRAMGVLTDGSPNMHGQRGVVYSETVNVEVGDDAQKDIGLTYLRILVIINTVNTERACIEGEKKSDAGF